MEVTDAAVVAQVLAGDRDAFRVLVERHSRSIFRVIYRMTGNQQDSEELVQETFLRALQKPGSF
jgi:RNA polymerase sigma-70 factor (ECF subfamily)